MKNSWKKLDWTGNFTLPPACEPQGSDDSLRRDYRLLTATSPRPSKSQGQRKHGRPPRPGTSQTEETSRVEFRYPSKIGIAVPQSTRCSLNAAVVGLHYSSSGYARWHSDAEGNQGCGYL